MPILNSIGALSLEEGGDNVSGPLTPYTVRVDTRNITTTLKIMNVTVDLKTVGGTVVINWGDGNSTTTKLTDTLLNFTHDYATAGVYEISVMSDTGYLWCSVGSGLLRTGNRPELGTSNGFGFDSSLVAVVSWGSSKFHTMSNMFVSNSRLNSIPSSYPDLSECQSTSLLFDYATIFNQDISGWDVSKVKNMNNMFANALRFNQNIGGWDVGNVTNMNSMFDTDGINADFNQDLSGWNVINVTKEPQSFIDGNTSWTLPKPKWGTSAGLGITSGDRIFTFFKGRAVNQSLGSPVGGTSPYKWTVSPALPSGLTMNASTGVITGTPTIDSAASLYTVTLSDSTKKSVNIVITLTVLKTMSVTATQTSYSFLKGKAVAAFNPLTVLNSTGTLKYAVSLFTTAFPTGLPAGMTLNTSLGSISGTPTAAASGRMGITVTDNSGTLGAQFDMEIISFILTVNNPSYKLKMGISSGTNSPVTVTGGTAPFTYAINPALPAGLTFSTSAGTFTGTPTQFSATTTYTITVTDKSAASVSKTFDIGVAIVPISVKENGTTYRLFPNVVVDSFAPFTGSGGVGALTYSISPALPTGLSMNTTTGIITGTPTVITTPTDYNITITDTVGTNQTNTFKLSTNEVTYKFKVLPDQYKNVHLNVGDRDGKKVYIDWGDGTSYSGVGSTDLIHKYSDTTTERQITLRSTSGYMFCASAHVTSVVEWGTQKFSTMNSMFAAPMFSAYTKSNLKSLPLTAPDLSECQDLSYMFYNCQDFNQNISNWDVSNVTDMSAMFAGPGAGGLNSFNQPLNNWNTWKVTNMYGMFSGGVFNQPLNNWNTGSVTNMASMFSRNSSFNQDISSWNTSNVIDMSGMFENSSLFNQPLNTWDTNNVVNMYGMFSGGVFNQPLNNWNTGSVTNMASMFSRNSSFNQDISSWNTSNVTSMVWMFNGAKAFNQPLSNWNTSNVTDMGSMFAGATSFNQPLTNWNTSNVTGMSFMFIGCSNFNQPLNHFDTSNVTNMSYMFSGSYSGSTISVFNQPLNNWNTSNVTDMSSMFYVCNFNQDINTWNTSNVTNMSLMFKDNPNFNQSLNNWNTSNVTTMRQMFSNASVFNGDISSWNTSNVTDMVGMFESTKLVPDWWNNQPVGTIVSGVSQFNQNIGNWNTGKVTNMTAMFNGACKFNQNISNWKTSNVTNMSRMFRGAAAFNQPLNAWDVGNVTNMYSMFSAESRELRTFATGNTYNPYVNKWVYLQAFNQPLNNWNTSNVTDMSYMFDSSPSFDQDIHNWNVGKVTSRAYFDNNTSSTWTAAEKPVWVA